MSRSTASAFLLSLLLPRALASVALADFKPYATDLSKACEVLYTAPIPGCSSSDFTSGSCSTGCVDALNGLVSNVTTTCAGVTGDNIIAAMLQGSGASALCSDASSNVASSSSSSSASQASATSTSETEPSSTATATDFASTTILYQTYSVEPQASSTLSGTNVIFETSTPAGVIEASKTAHTTPSSPTSTNINEGGSLLSSQTGAGVVIVAKGIPGLLLSAAAGAALLL